MKKKIFKKIMIGLGGLFFLSMIQTLSAQTSPGGVSSNLQLWLRADKGTNNWGSNIWADYATSANCTVYGATLNTSTNLHNFNPSVYFDGGDYIKVYSGFADFAEGLSSFVYTKPSTSTAYREFYEFSNGNNKNNLFFGRTGASGYLWGHIVDGSTSTLTSDDLSPIDNTAAIYSFDFSAGTPGTNDAAYYIYKNGYLDKLSTGNERLTNVTRSTNYIGNASYGHAKFLGDIPEVILYNRKLSEIEQLRVNSYLAIKYGVTLPVDNNGDNNKYDEIVTGLGIYEGDYLASDNTVIWNASNDKEFNNNIFGIGLDSSSALDQRISKASEDSVLTISTNVDFTGINDDSRPALNSDLSFMMVGSNDSSIIARKTTELPVGYDLRTSRIWKVQLTNFSNDVFIQIKGDEFYPLSTRQYYLVTSTKEDFSTLESEVLIDANQKATVSFTNPNTVYYMTIAEKVVVAPGGVAANLQMWVRADNSVTVSGSNVTYWKDYFNGKICTGENNPTYTTLSHNFNPGVYLNGTSYLDIYSGFSNFSLGLTTFASLKKDATAGDYTRIFSISRPSFVDNIIFYVHPNGLGLSIYRDAAYKQINATSVITNPTNENIYSSSIVANTPSLSTSVSASLYANNKTLTTDVSTIYAPQNLVREAGMIGQDNRPKYQIQADISEIIVYNKDLSPSEKHKVNSYLALKYGITLDQTTATNYLSSDGSTVMWNATTAGSYKNDIFGLGRDEKDALYQRVSKSVNDDAIITLSLNTDFTSSNLTRTETLTDLNFQTISNNGGTATWTTTGAPSGYEILARQWKIQETGTIGDVYLQFDVNDTEFNLPDLIAGTSYFILIDTDNDCSLVDETPVALTEAATGLWVTGAIDFSNGQIFTLGTYSKYTITYNLDGGTHTNTPATYNYTQSVSIAPPIKTGYTFTGWTIVNDSVSSPSITQPATPATTPTTFGPKTVYGNLTLTANWQANTYTITYSLPTGAIHSQTPNSYLFTDAVTVVNPSLPGYTFLGWTITNDSVSSPTITPTKNVSFGPSTVYGNLTFTAATPPATGGNTNWSQITYNITYNLNGGTSGTNHPATYAVTSNVTIDIPTKLGYTFAGWTIVSDSASASLPTSGNPTTFASGSNVYGNLTFTATWSTNQYMITYNAGATGATIVNPPINNPTTYDVTNTPISLDNGGAKRNGYSFKNWAMISDSTSIIILNGMTVPANTVGNLTCTAQWNLNNYNITYTIPSGVTNPNTLLSYDVTQIVGISNPSLPGYTFLGWTVTNDSVSSPAVTPTKNVAWTANTIFGDLNFSVTNAAGVNWSENTYTITYAYAGGTAPTTANPTTYTVTTSSIALNSPTRTGYTFSGWTIVSDSSSVTVPFGTSIPTGTYGNLTCTAVWGAVPYDITYNYNDDATDHSTTPSNPATYNLDILPVSISLQPTRNIWDFTGWTGANGTTPQTSVIITSTSPGVPGALSYTANWTKKKYALTYDLNGGIGTAPTDTNSPYEWGTSVTALDTLTGTSKTNAVFVGWTTTVYPSSITSLTDTVGYGSHNPGTTFAMPTQNTTLYAVWAEDINGPSGGSDGIPDYMQVKLIYNENQRTGSQSVSGTLPPTTMYIKNTSATVAGNIGNLQRNPADSLMLIGWSKTVHDNKDVKESANKPSDLILFGNTISIAESDINLYAVWAYDINGNGIADCDEPNVTIEPENEWPETESGTPKWNYQYDEDNANSWYCGCNMILTMTVSPDLQFERTININYLGALKKGFVVDEDGEVLADSYTLAKGDSVFTLNISIVEDSITSANEGQTGAVETAIVGGGRDTSEWFTLYSHPSYEIALVKPLIRSDKTVDFGITGGTPNLMRSINGGPWRNVYLPLTAAEQLSVTDGATIWLREPNGCWEAEFVFMTYDDPTVLRYVDIASTAGITTVPGAGKHYVEGHQDFSFTASYAGGLPLKVMAKGYYTGTYEELIGQNMDDGTLKYTIVQVTEPWNVTFGPDLASGTVGNDLIDNTYVWSFNNTLYIRSEVNTKADIYNISGTLYKRLTVTEGDTHEELLRGIYVVAIGDKRFKVIIK